MEICKDSGDPRRKAYVALCLQASPKIHDLWHHPRFSNKNELFQRVERTLVWGTVANLGSSVCVLYDLTNGRFFQECVLSAVVAQAGEVKDVIFFLLGEFRDLLEADGIGGKLVQ